MHLIRISSFFIIASAFILAFSPAVPSAENCALYAADGNVIPFFTLTSSLENEELLVVNILSVSCAPCKKEIPALLSLFSENKGVRLVFIFAEDADSIKKSAHYQLCVKGNSSILSDDFLGTFQKKNAVTRYPTTIVFSGKGETIARFEGYSDDNIYKLKKITGTR